MKKLLTVGITASVLALSGCATTADQANGINVHTGVSIGKTVFQTAVDSKCRTTMNNNQYWKLLSPILSATKKTEIQNSVCGCVSKKAVESVTPGELATAVVDQNSRNQLVVNAVTKSFSGCYGEITKSLNLTQ